MAHLSVGCLIALSTAFLVAGQERKSRFFGKAGDHVRPPKVTLVTVHINPREPVVVPFAERFDARERWPHCESIRLIRDQGECNTCWAVTGSSVLSDRICIASGQTENVLISANQAAGCAKPWLNATANCDEPGDPAFVYEHAVMYGLPTGGELNSSVGCVPYTVPPGGTGPLTCARECINPEHKRPLARDTRRVDSYWVRYHLSNSTLTPKQIDEAVAKMKAELITNGPISAEMVPTTYDDFKAWNSTSSNGLCYSGPGVGAKEIGGHAVKIIGWDKDRAGTPYWLISNTWGTGRGDNGTYWVALGRNLMGIEGRFAAPTIVVPDTCDGETFCSQPIDAAVTFNTTARLSKFKDRYSRTPGLVSHYLFQGDCVQRVLVDNDGVLAAFGPAVAISKVFINAPPSPITHTTQSTDGRVELRNAAGQSRVNCTNAAFYDAALYNKFIACSDPGTTGLKLDVETSFSNGTGTSRTFWKYSNQRPATLHGNDVPHEIGELVTRHFDKVNALLNMNGNINMLVFGTSKGQPGSPLIGIMSYPRATQEATWVQEPVPMANLLSCSRVWMLLDLNFYPSTHTAFSAWCLTVTGAILLVILNVVQYDLTERFLEPEWSLQTVVIKRLYTLISGFANVFFCKGVWMVQDHYFEVTIPSACFSLILGTSLLLFLRASCNGVSTPLGTAFDEDNSFFIIGTRFRTQADKRFLLLLDSIFSVTVIGSLVIFEWRGIWVLLDLLLFPDNPTLALLVCLVFGYLMCIIVDLIQNKAVAISAHLEAKNHGLLRLAFEDVYLLVAKWGVIIAWHGIWSFCENYVANRNGPDQFARLYINIVIGYIVPTLLLHGNSLFVLEVVLDGGLVEGEGCRVRITMLEHYLELCARNYSAKHEYAISHGAKVNGINNTQRRSLHGNVDSAQTLRHNIIADCHFENRSFSYSEFLPP
ncbi:putative Cathepsin B-like cysteine proteinase 5 [Hypsibius exemplaris]|uniref:Cathepsin B-like cysteine proteinase 5 n=1 Tax=Hypsibius exemplaris TaxID=2072580 RepID=A0A1W0WBQ0_HYPEX|nr:putative Cathepsin B-like cysteine proteinase 5 [Hypsibius exemplaris]